MGNDDVGSARQGSGREFKKFSKVVGQLDLHECLASSGRDWHRHPRRMGEATRQISPASASPARKVTPYVSVFDGDAIPGQPPPNTSADNQWLISSALNTFVLAHRAGLKSDFPREYDDWSKHPMLFMPSPSPARPATLFMCTRTSTRRRRSMLRAAAFCTRRCGRCRHPRHGEPFGARLADTAIVF